MFPFWMLVGGGRGAKGSLTFGFSAGIFAALVIFAAADLPLDVVPTPAAVPTPFAALSACADFFDSPTTFVFVSEIDLSFASSASLALVSVDLPFASPAALARELIPRLKRLDFSAFAGLIVGGGSAEGSGLSHISTTSPVVGVGVGIGDASSKVWPLDSMSVAPVLLLSSHGIGPAEVSILSGRHRRGGGIVGGG